MGGKTQLIIILLILLVCGLVCWMIVTDKQTFMRLSGGRTLEEVLHPKRNTLIVGDAYQGSGQLLISINPLKEFDRKTKSELFKIREEAVYQYPQLLAGDYSPSSDVFGQIADKKPWWGMHGTYFYGPGEKSIEGLSEESRIFANPYLLIGVIEPAAYIAAIKPSSKPSYYPFPLRLRFSPGNKQASIIYSVKSHFRFLKKHDYNNARFQWLDLVAYNARDFRYRYLYLDPESARGVTVIDTKGAPVQIQQLINQEPSCGYSGGCNNMSPFQKELRISVTNLPALLKVRLWKKKPPSSETEPDFKVEMHLW